MTILAIGLALLAINGSASFGAPRQANEVDGRREADRIVADAQAADLFENVTVDTAPRLRHLRSGMVCWFEPANALNNVHLYPSASPRGDDVSCGTNLGGAAVTLYATRYDPMPTPQQEVLSILDAIQRQWSRVETYPLQWPLEGPSPYPPTRLVLKGRHPNGQTAVTIAIVRHVNGWSIMTRVSGLEPDAQRLALAANAINVTAAADVAAATPAEP